VKLKDSKGCHCPGPDYPGFGDWEYLLCGCCQGLRCTRCGRVFIMVAQLFCRTHHGPHMRQVLFPGMAPKKSVPAGKRHVRHRPKDLR
jgi:hypothetical protein